MSDERKIPVCSLERVFKLRQRLLDDNFYSDVLDTEISGTLFSNLVASIHDKFELKNVYQATECVRHLLGKKCTQEVIYELAWRLAGNEKTLRAGLPVQPWTRQVAEEWVPVQIIGSQYLRRKAGVKSKSQVGRLFQFRILAGSPCPMKISKFWNNSAINLIASRLGFGPWMDSKLHKRDHAELFGLRMMVMLEPRLSHREPGFFHLACPPSLRDFNIEQIKKLRRVDFNCPKDYQHQCYQCPVGREECPAATHFHSYKTRDCPGCKRQWWFDPAGTGEYCVDCQPRIDSGLPLNVKKIVS